MAKPEPDRRWVEFVRNAEDIEPRCGTCGRMLGRAFSRPWTLNCPRCGSLIVDGRVVERGNR